MRYYPWRWFSDLVYVGAGGFSSVYAANIALLFDVPEPGRTFGTYKRGVAIKVVDEKILNEVGDTICIQWKHRLQTFNV